MNSQSATPAPTATRECSAFYSSSRGDAQKRLQPVERASAHTVNGCVRSIASAPRETFLFNPPRKIDAADDAAASASRRTQPGRRVLFKRCDRSNEGRRHFGRGHPRRGSRDSKGGHMTQLALDAFAFVFGVFLILIFGASAVGAVLMPFAMLYLAMFG